MYVSLGDIKTKSYYSNWYKEFKQTTFYVRAKSTGD